VELAVRDWSRRDGDVAGRLRRADNRRMTFVRSLFGEFCADEDEDEDEVEVRSMMSYSTVIASYFVAVEHSDKTRCCSSRSTTCSGEAGRRLEGQHDPRVSLGNLVGNSGIARKP